MPNIKANKKHLRQTKKRTLKNKAGVSKVKNVLKKVRASNAEEAKKQLPNAISTIDKAVQNGIIKKGTGSRYKSRLMLAVAAKK